jgi:putative sugar O-methyltransferase
MAPVIQAHQNNDLKSLQVMYENFFREPLSTGLHGLHFDMVKTYMTPEAPPSDEQARAYMEFCALGARNFILSCPGTPAQKLVRPPIGNPYGYQLDSHEIYPCAEYHFSFAQKISILLKKVERPSIMDLGGGFGGMAYYCAREIPNSRIVCIDLPENAALQAYYLTSMFPGKAICLYGDGGDPADCDIYIAPNFAIEELAENEVNLSFNSYSLAEMGEEAIKNYVKTISKITSDYFYHLNHVYWEISADSFPVDLEKFELLFRNPTNWGKDYRNYRLDQHEFLYKARNSNI